MEWIEAAPYVFAGLWVLVGRLARSYVAAIVEREASSIGKAKETELYVGLAWLAHSLVELAAAPLLSLFSTTFLLVQRSADRYYFVITAFVWVMLIAILGYLRPQVRLAHVQGQRFLWRLSGNTFLLLAKSAVVLASFLIALAATWDPPGGN